MDFDYMHMVGGKKPSGTIKITENGEYDVAEYAKADVNVETNLDLLTAKIISRTADGVIRNEHVTSVGTYTFENTKISFIDFPNAIKIGSYAFKSCNMLTDVMLEKAEYLDTRAFYGCSELTNIVAENVSNFGNEVFSGCKKLRKYKNKKSTSIQSETFRGCDSIEIVDFYKLSFISGSAFSGCYTIRSLVIRNTSTISSIASNSKIENNTNITVYVPDELVDSYKVATNWSVIADRIRPLSEYVEEV